MTRSGNATVSSARRALEIAALLVVFLSVSVARRIRPRSADRSDALAFARLLQRLGTTFIKLGQHLSMRPDVFSPETLSALATLQDRVESIPDEVALAGC